MKHIGDLTDSKVAALYADVPRAELEKFQAFCKAYPYRHLSYGGFEWPYLIAQTSGVPLLALSGALTHPDISWQSLSHFGEQFRLVAPAYPAVRTMEALCDGLAEILRREGIASAHVLGGSYGGFVAQVFARRYPAMTRSLVLSHTAAPDATGLNNVRRMVKMFSLLPTGGLRWVLGRSLGKIMPADTSAPAMRLMLAMFREIMHYHLTKADFLGILDRTLDFYGRAFTPEDLAGWPGKVLLVLAEDDPASPERVRAALQQLYPQAELHLFQGTGHVTSVSNQVEYQAVIGEFLYNQSDHDLKP